MESQEDETIVFRSDGTGWIEWQSWGEHIIQFFLWAPTSPDWYVLTHQKRMERDPHNLKRFIEREPLTEWEHLSMRIEEVVTPRYGAIWQLEVEMAGWNAGIYGLLAADADAKPFPQTLA